MTTVGGDNFADDYRTHGRKWCLGFFENDNKTKYSTTKSTFPIIDRNNIVFSISSVYTTPLGRIQGEFRFQTPRNAFIHSSQVPLCISI